MIAVAPSETGLPNIADQGRLKKYYVAGIGIRCAEADITAFESDAAD